MGKSIVNTVGIILMVFGFVGFFNDPLFGVFNVDPALNIFHLISGILALTFGNVSKMSARNFALIYGIIFALMMVIGFTSAGTTKIMGMMVDNATSWLYLLFTALLLPLGFARHPRPAVRSA